MQQSSIGIKGICIKILRHRLLRLSASNFLVRGFSACVALLASIIFANKLGPTEFGLYSFVFAMVMLVSVPCQLGFPVLIVRYTATYLEKNNGAAIRGLWGWCISISLLLSFVVAVVIYIGFDLISVQKELQKPPLLYLLILILPLCSLIPILSACIRGLGAVVVASLPDGVGRPVILLSVFLLLANYMTPSAEVAIISWTAGLAAALLLSLYTLLKKVPTCITSNASRLIESAKWWKSAVPMILTASASVIIQYSDLVMLGFMAENADVGIYRVMMALILPLPMVLEAVGSVLAPRIATLYEKSDLDKLQTMLTRGAVFIAGLGLPILGIMLFAHEHIITILFGEEYLVGSSALIILICAQIVNLFFGPLAVVLNMTGKSALVARVFVYAAALNLCLNALLIPFWGTTGAAVATLASITIWNTFLFIACRKILNLDTSFLGVIRYTRFSSASAKSIR